MKVYYCKKCERYKFSNRLKNNECRICGSDLQELEVDFLTFSKMNEEERKVILNENCC